MGQEFGTRCRTHNSSLLHDVSVFTGMLQMAVADWTSLPFHVFQGLFIWSSYVIFPARRPEDLRLLMWSLRAPRVNVQEATVETLGLLLTWHQKSQDNTFAFYWPSTYYGQPRFEGRQTRLHLSVGGIANNLQPSLIYQSRGLA